MCKLLVNALIYILVALVCPGTPDVELPEHFQLKWLVFKVQNIKTILVNKIAPLEKTVDLDANLTIAHCKHCTSVTI